jgi:hypothetical protein
MSSASDISNLFQMLGVSPSQYQEVERTEQVQGARGRWSTPTSSSPADITRDDAPREAEVVLPTETAEAVVPPEAAEVAPAAPPQPIASAAPDAVSEPLPAVQLAPEQAVLQSNPEPVIVPQQPDSLSAVFARLRERSGPQEDAAQRQPS